MSEAHGTLTELGTRQALNAALAKAQADFPTIPKSRTVTVQKKAGGSYTYAYAPLDAILTEVRPILAANGLALVQLLEDDGRGPSLRTELRHAEGGQLSGTFPLPGSPADPQALGSLLTYLRRYAITAILGIATETDDDGAGAKPKPKPKPRAEPKPKPDPGPSQFAPPEPKPGPELAPLVTEVQDRFTQLRNLEAQLGETEPRDWTAWVRGELGLGERMGSAEDYRRAVELLAKEQSRLIAELARKTAEAG